MPRQSSIAKITPPRLQNVLLRKRLFDLLDEGRHAPVTWVTGPGGSGKTTLVASWLDAKKLPCLWYQVDEGDGDMANFFYYLGMAAQKAAPRYRRRLPLLTPEYLQDIPTFTRNYFENLYARLKPRVPFHPLLTEEGRRGFATKGEQAGFVIVLDNYQEASERSLLHGVVSNALSLIPEGIEVFVLSRSEPPSVFMRLRANGAMRSVGWHELRFTLEEAKQIIGKKEKANLGDYAVAELHKKTEGWAAGLILLSEQAVQGDMGPELAGRLAELSRDAIFEYFAGEIFSRLDSETTDFLLMSAFLPKMTVQMARKMTHQDNADHILHILHRNNFFTEKHKTTEPTYQYHPLFREFLLARMKESLNPAGLLRVQKRAAAVLEESGQIEDAIEFYLQASDWGSAGRIMLGYAQAILRQGRSNTLEGWLNRIPQAILEATPWLLYWLGVCAVSRQPAEARGHFEQALRLFGMNKDAEGEYLSWSAAVDTFNYEWNNFTQLDPWIEWFEQRHREGFSFPSKLAEAKVAASISYALMTRKPDHPGITSWVECSIALSQELPDINAVVHVAAGALSYYFWTGDIDKCKLIPERVFKLASSGNTSSLLKMTCHFLELMLGLCYRESTAAGLRKVQEALKAAEETGIHLWDHMFFASGVYSCLLQSDFVAADAYLKRMGSILTPSRRHMSCPYNYLMAWRNMSEGKFVQALAPAETALRLAEETGYIFPHILCLIEMGSVLHGNRRTKEAAQCLARAYEMSQKTKSDILAFSCLLVQAYMKLDSGMAAEGTEHLTRAMALGKKRRYLAPLWWWQPSVMTRLCTTALEKGIETEYAQFLIKTHNLMTQPPPIHILSWPWPLKIYTLGTFRIELKGKPVVFMGKVQKKPLEMLKFVIATGGRDVPEEQAVDALWPDAEGDAGHKSFENTVARLRKLLGNDTFILLRDGKLTLDSRSCWVDAWAVGRVIDTAQAEWNKGAHPSDRTLELAEKALLLYTGPFLEGETSKAWTVSPRERLKSSCIRMVGLLVSHWKSKGAWERVIQYLSKGLEIDELAEDLRRELMACYREIGREIDAIKTYHHFREVLAKSLGIEPSSTTEALYRELIEEKRKPSSH